MAHIRRETSLMSQYFFPRSFELHQVRSREPKMSQKAFLIALTIAIVLCMTVQAEAKRKSEDKINS